MAKPSRPSDPKNLKAQSRTFFVTSRTAFSRPLLQTDCMANLFVDVLRCYMRAGKFKVHDFVVMPNHVHLLITVNGDMGIEKTTQLIKGGFSFRARKELEFLGEVWQRGFSDVRIKEQQSFRAHQLYIYNNPVTAGLASSPDQYAPSSLYLRRLKAQELKPISEALRDGTAEAVP
jgi:REP-associated tyrosine transposase